MSRFRYSGPNSAVTLKAGDGKGATSELNVMLWHGREVELPENHDYVKVLVAKGHLAPVLGATPAASAPAPNPAPDSGDAGKSDPAKAKSK